MMHPWSSGGLFHVLGVIGRYLDLIPNLGAKHVSCRVAVTIKWSASPCLLCQGNSTGGNGWNSETWDGYI